MKKNTIAQPGISLAARPQEKRDVQGIRARCPVTFGDGGARLMVCLKPFTVPVEPLAAIDQKVFKVLGGVSVDQGTRPTPFCVLCTSFAVIDLVNGWTACTQPKPFGKTSK